MPSTFSALERGSYKHRFRVRLGDRYQSLCCGWFVRGSLLPERVIDIELLYGELYAIAKHQGPLDEGAVTGATSLLALPRYARAEPSPAGRLVEDLKLVIAGVSTDTRPNDDVAAEPWASRFFQSYARRYFSLDAPGEAITKRRAFWNVMGLTGTVREAKVEGITATWMTRGVVYRVAAGLLALWAEADSQSLLDAADGLNGGYHIQRVRVTRQLQANGRGVGQDHIIYDIDILRPGPQLLILPFPRKLTTISPFLDSEIVRPPPQLITVTMHRKRIAAVVFGAHKPGTRLRLIVQHVRHQLRAPTAIFFPVDQPIDLLGLQVERNGRSPTELRWEATSTNTLGEETVLERSVSNPWFYHRPAIGLGYQLTGREWRKGESPPKTDEPPAEDATPDRHT